jgi:excisionase family DNA binding protein
MEPHDASGAKRVWNGRWQGISILESLLVTAKEAAALCSVSERTWRIWHSAGRIPRPVQIGRTVRWRRDEISAWIAAGCTRRADWEVRRS